MPPGSYVVLREKSRAFRRDVKSVEISPKDQNTRLSATRDKMNNMYISHNLV